jgi:hypothetical protein
LRAALISLPQPGEAAQPVIAGKTIAQRQLLFARECGCTLVIAHGGGASPDGIGLRHAAEQAGMRYQVISTSHALPGAIGAADSLLVLQPGLLPEARAALDLLRAEGDRLLVVAAGPGTAAGFERIDLDRAWGGALTIPGAWLGRLTSLPEDAAPQPALLRIALQHRLPEARLADLLLDDGRWMIVMDADAAGRQEARWLSATLGDAPPAAPSRWLARQIIARAGAWLTGWRWARPSMLGLFALLLGGAVASAWREFPAAGFALAALAAVLLEGFLALSRLAVAPFGKIGWLAWLRRATDAVLLVIGVLAIDSLPHRAAFPPIVLVAALLLLDRGALRRAVEPLRDRALVAGTIALIAGFVAPEIAIMLASVLVLAANLVPRAGQSG